MFDDATPTTGMPSLPARAMSYSAGKIFLWTRSPVTPKRTSASERPSWLMAIGCPGARHVLATLQSIPASAPVGRRERRLPEERGTHSFVHHEAEERGGAGPGDAAR